MGISALGKSSGLLLMILILHYLEDPKLWDQPYGRSLEIVNLAASFKDMEDAGRSRPVDSGG